MELISVQDALKKYGIRTFQLQHIVNNDLVMLYDDYGEALYRGKEFNILRGRWINTEANDRTPTRVRSRLWGNSYRDDIDELWQGRLRAEREAKELYDFDNVIYAYLFAVAELESALQKEFPEMYAAYESICDNESYFISSKEINQQFPNIREAQLYEIIKQDTAKIYDYRGEEFGGYREFETRRTKGPYKDNPFQAIRECVSFVRNQLPAILTSIFPTLIDRGVFAPTNSHANAENNTFPLDTWTTILETEILSVKDKEAISIILLIFKGKKHDEIFDTVFPNQTVTDKTASISKRRKKGRDLAKKFADKLNIPFQKLLPKIWLNPDETA